MTENLKKAKRLFEYLLSKEPPEEVRGELLVEIEKCSALISENESPQVSVDLANKTIKLGDQSGRLEKRLYGITQEVIEQGAIHWTKGYCLFRGWCSKSQDKPARQFDKSVSAINNLYKGVQILARDTEAGVWKFSGNVIVDCPFFEHRQAIEEAFQKSDFKSMESVLRKALDAAPESWLVHQQVVLFAARAQEQDVPRLIKELRLFHVLEELRIRKENFKLAVGQMQSEGKNAGWKGDWEKASAYILDIEQERAKLEELHRTLSEVVGKEGLLSKEESECAKLRGLFAILQSQGEREKQPDCFIQLLKNPEIKSVTDKMAKQLMRWIVDYNLPHESKGNLQKLASACLVKTAMEKPVKVVSLRSFRSFVFRAVGKRVKDMYLIQISRLEKDRLKKFWEILKIRREFKHKPTAEDIYTKLPGWDEEEMHEMLYIVNNLRQQTEEEVRRYREQAEGQQVSEDEKTNFEQCEESIKSSLS